MSVFNNLENIPACLRVIARQIEAGEIRANVGVLALRQAGTQAESVVFGFGKELDPFLEMELAAARIMEIASTPAEEQGQISG